MSKNKTNKICGKCKEFVEETQFCIYNEFDTTADAESCDFFERPTNGDKIRQGGDESLIDFADGIRKRMCHYCIFSQEKSCVNKTNDCWDGVRKWLKQEAKDE